MAEDIVTNVEANEGEVLALKKAHYDTGGGTRTPAPVQSAQVGLNEELVQMLKMGRKWNQFQGIDRCIRVLDPGTPSQRHCFAMMVKDMTQNKVVCSSCDRIRDLNAHPRVINSSMIKLSQKELEEFHMVKDPLENAKPEPIVKAKRLKKTDEVSQRRPKMAVPNKVVIEVTLKDIEDSEDIPALLMQKALEGIFNLPIAKYSDAEKIRMTSDRIKKFLSK